MDSLQIALLLIVAAASIFFVLLRQPSSKALDVIRPVKKEFREYTWEEVAKHNTKDDAWIVVRNSRSKVLNVYDITAYIDDHPGGDAILRNIGREATEGFHGPQHPETVFVMVEEYLIGEISE